MILPTVFSRYTQTVILVDRFNFHFTTHATFMLMIYSYPLYSYYCSPPNRRPYFHLGQPFHVMYYTNACVLHASFYLYSSHAIIPLHISHQFSTLTACWNLLEIFKCIGVCPLRVQFYWFGALGLKVILMGSQG